MFSQYGKVVELSFLQEKINGKSKGYLHFYFYASVACVEMSSKESAQNAKATLNNASLNGNAIQIVYDNAIPNSVKNGVFNHQAIATFLNIGAVASDDFTYNSNYASRGRGGMRGGKSAGRGGFVDSSPVRSSPQKSPSPQEKPARKRSRSKSRDSPGM